MPNVESSRNIFPVLEEGGDDARKTEVVDYVHGDEIESEEMDPAD